MGPCRDKVKKSFENWSKVKGKLDTSNVDLEMNAGICSTDLVLYTLVRKQMNESCSDKDSI